MQYDLIIQSGLIIDGSGGSEQTADVGIRSGKIETIGDLARAQCVNRINAAGLVVSPGFIDVHTHSDVFILIEPEAPSKLYQGVTTEIVGNCGASAAPLLEQQHLPSDWRNKPLPDEWNTVAEYRSALQKAAPAINIALLAGHNTLRAGVAGYENRALTASEMRRMQSLLEQALEEGALGLSTGLLYAPGLFAGAEEINALAAIVASHNGIYTSHMRSESDELLSAVNATIDVGRKSGARVEISHLKASGRRNWPLCKQAVEIIQKARDSGIDVAADRYPYTTSSTDLDVIFPVWAAAGGREAVLKRLEKPAIRQRLTDELSREFNDEYWQTITIGSTQHPENQQFRGCRLIDAAAKLKLDPAQTVIHFARSDRLMTGAFFSGMSEDNLDFILTRPWVMPGSDASLRAVTGPLSTDHPHPRAYGTFPNYLRRMLDKKLLSLPEAIHKMTALPASHFRLGKRGLLKNGYAADITVFDPANLCDNATYAEPHQYASGIHHVIVAGKPALLNSRITGQRGGAFIAP